MKQSMKALRLKTAGVVAVENVDIPQPLGNEVLIRVQSAGLCQTDLHIRKDPAQSTPCGTILGHEIAGEVVALGSGVTDWKIGNRVVVHPCWACHTCVQCRSGRENACQGNGQRLLPPPTPGVSVNGGMAEFAIAPASALIDIGDLDPAMAAVLADAGLTPYHSVNLVREKLVPGSTAVVIGVGGLGQFAVQILRLLTPARIVAIDISQSALALVAKYVDHGFEAGREGLAQSILAVTDNCGAEVVLDLVGNDGSLALAASVIAPYGAIQAIGLNAGTLPFETGIVSSVGLPWGATVMKPYSGTYRDLTELIALARNGKLDATIRAFSLDDAVDAFDLLAAGQIYGRAVLVPIFK